MSFLHNRPFAVLVILAAIAFMLFGCESTRGYQPPGAGIYKALQCTTP